MFTQIIKIDENGSITLSPEIIEALGVGKKTDITIELTKEGAIIKSKEKALSITDRIASMELPVNDWEDMEREINGGRLK